MTNTYDDIPRRCRIDRLIPEEKLIREALIAVEALGAHPLLTAAVQALDAAQVYLANWHDSGRPGGAR